MNMKNQTILLSLGLASLVGCGSSSDSNPQSGEGGEKTVNQAPFVENVQASNWIMGQSVLSGTELTASYRYFDAEEDVEGATKVEWLLDGESVAEGGQFTVPRTAADKNITIRVTPIAQTGTLEGTAVVSEAIPVAKRQFVPFTADSNDPMREMYVTDGTEDGTYPVADFAKADYKEYSRQAIRYGDKWLLSVDTDDYGVTLAVSDGTEEGTKLVDGLRLTGLAPTNFVVFKDKVFFNGTTRATGSELWVTDGTAEGTYEFKDIAPGYMLESNPHRGSPKSFVVAGDKLFFNAYTPANGNEPWVSDGTPEGTRMITDLTDDYWGSDLGEFFGFKDKAYFYSEAVDLFYETDGTEQGTKAYSVDYLTKPVRYIDYGDHFVMQVQNREGWNGAGLMISDGTEEGTEYIGNTDDNQFISWITVLGSQLFFKDSSKLYRYTVGSRITPIESEVNIVQPLVAYNGYLYFSGAVNGEYELYKYSGASSFEKVKDINEGEGSSYPEQFYSLDTDLFFLADDGIHGKEAWITDGTEEGTKMLKDIFPGATSSSANLCNIVVCIR